MSTDPAAPLIFPKEKDPRARREDERDAIRDQALDLSPGIGCKAVRKEIHHQFSL